MEENKNAFEIMKDGIRKLEKRVQEIYYIEEVETADGFQKRIDSLKEKFHNKLQSKNNYILAGDFDDIIEETGVIKYDIDNYFEKEGNEIKCRKTCERYERKINEIVSNMDEKGSIESWSELRKIVNELNSEYDRNPRLKGYDFNNFVSKAVLELLINQVKSGEKIDLYKIQDFCNEDDLIYSINEKLIDMSMREENTEKRYKILETARNLNQDSLTDGQVWKELSGVEKIEFGKKEKQELAIINTKIKIDWVKLLGLSVYTLGDIDPETNEWINVKEVYGRFPKKFSKKEADRVLAIEVNGVKKLKQNYGTKKIHEMYGSLQKIVLGDDVREIENFALAHCRNLKSVEFGNGVKEIPKWCCGDSGIESIRIPDTVEKIGDGAFSECTHLKSAEIGSGVTELPVFCFSSSGFEEIKIPKNIEKIDYCAFWKCYNLKSAEIENGVTEIGESCFELSGIETIVIPDSVKKIGYGAFRKCQKLKSSKIGRGVTELPSYCFEDSGLEKIKIPGNVEKTGFATFDKCKNLKSAEIENGVIEIGVCCFASSGIERIVIPSSVEKIGDAAFGKCKKLNSVEIENVVTKIGRLNPHYIYRGVDEIGNSCFYETGIENITIPSSVKKIGEYAFLRCTKLESIAIPDNVEEIGKGALADCDNLKSIEFGSGVREIPDHCCTNCGIESMKIPGSMEKIGHSAFELCQKLKNAEIENGVKEIGNSSFAGVGIETIVIPDSVEKIGNHAFFECKNLKSVEIENNVPEIPRNCFDNCEKLNKIYIGNDVAIDLNTLYRDILKVDTVKKSDGEYEDMER